MLIGDVCFIYFSEWGDKICVEVVGFNGEYVVLMFYMFVWYIGFGCLVEMIEKFL